jgi:hypothetical protein
MKKLTLFNIELTCDIDEFSGYFAAENAAGAEILARKAIITDHLTWWEEEGRLREAADIVADMTSDVSNAEEILDKIYQERVDELNKMRVTMLIEMGTIVI